MVVLVVAAKCSVRLTRDVDGRNDYKNDGRVKFQEVGAIVGVAWDAVAGSLLVGVNGADLVPLFPQALAPGSVVGAGLFPALSGEKGCRVGWNLGRDLARRPFRHPPPAGFLPCADAAAQQVATRA